MDISSAIFLSHVAISKDQVAQTASHLANSALCRVALPLFEGISLGMNILEERTGPSHERVDNVARTWSVHKTG
jgi:hypothetical protein